MVTAEVTSAIETLLGDGLLLQSTGGKEREMLTDEFGFDRFKQMAMEHSQDCGHESVACDSLDQSQSWWLGFCHSHDDARTGPLRLRSGNCHYR